MSKQVLSVEQMQHLQELGMELKETCCIGAAYTTVGHVPQQITANGLYAKGKITPV